MEPLTGAVIMVAVISGIVAAVAIKKHYFPEKWTNMTNALGQLTIAIPIALVIIGLGAPSIAEELGLVEPAEVVLPDGPVVEEIEADKEGYVLASVRDTYQVPTTMIADAIVYISLSRPVANNSWVSVAQDNTESTGSVLVVVSGVTSGTVYVTGYKAGYYSDYVATTVPGAQEMPTADLIASVPLTHTGTLLITQYDNSHAEYSLGTISVDNAATSAYITLDFTCENVWHAIKDLRMLGIRGSYWSTLGVSLSPVIISDASLAAVTLNDPTLTNSTTGGYDFPGDLEYARTLRVRFTISKTASSGAGLNENEELFRISLNDLGGLKGYVGETGTTETTLTFEAADNCK